MVEACPICGKNCGSKSGLLKHTPTHTKEWKKVIADIKIIKKQIKSISEELKISVKTKVQKKYT